MVADTLREVEGVAVGLKPPDAVEGTVALGLLLCCDEPVRDTEGEPVGELLRDTVLLAVAGSVAVPDVLAQVLALSESDAVGLTDGEGDGESGADAVPQDVAAAENDDAPLVVADSDGEPLPVLEPLGDALLVPHLVAVELAQGDTDCDPELLNAPDTVRRLVTDAAPVLLTEEDADAEAHLLADGEPDGDRVVRAEMLEDADAEGLVKEEIDAKELRERDGEVVTDGEPDGEKAALRERSADVLRAPDRVRLEVTLSDRVCDGVCDSVGDPDKDAELQALPLRLADAEALDAKLLLLVTLPQELALGVWLAVRETEGDDVSDGMAVGVNPALAQELELGHMLGEELALRTALALYELLVVPVKDNKPLSVADALGERDSDGVALGEPVKLVNELPERLALPLRVPLGVRLPVVLTLPQEVRLPVALTDCVREGDDDNDTAALTDLRPLAHALELKDTLGEPLSLPTAELVTEKDVLAE